MIFHPYEFAVFALGLLAASTAQVHASDDVTWFDNGSLRRQAVDVLEVLDGAEGYGLRPRDYETGLAPSEIQSILAGNADPALRTRFDAAVSAAVSRFVTHLHCGRVSARAAGFHLARCEFDTALALRRLAATSDVSGTLASFEPRPAPYRSLKRALAKYRDLARRPELTRLPILPARSIRLGDHYIGAPGLRTLLVALGDLPSSVAAASHDRPHIDAELAEALRRFQRRHGLDADGVLGPHTFAVLTTPLHGRVRQIELTLERWRWIASLERPEIVVNIPQFMLYALPRPGETPESMLEMRVIVGQSYPHTRTPIFAGAIQHVIFRPFWDVPTGVMRREVLPQIRRNPAYLERHHMEIVRGPGDDAKVLAPTPEVTEALAAGQLRLRQRPGPDNALGLVKFVIPNPYNVYLHATPEEALFERSRRAFSHGCIRVSDPVALAEYVLENAAGDWNAAAIEAAMCCTKTLRVELHTPVRAVIFYSTAAATQSRGVLFFEDIYGHDRKLEMLLARDVARAH